MVSEALDRIVDALASAEAAAVDPNDPTLLQLKQELETLAREARKPVLEAKYHDELALRRGLEFVKAIGRDPASQGQHGGRTNEERVLDSLREYKLLSKIGEGGMGAVYEARHTKLDKVVALKVLPAERTRDEAAVARFEREMRAVGRLDHPNIVRAMDAGEVEGTHFLVMEYVAGVDLSTLVKRLGPLPVKAACELVRQAAVGLSLAHELGIVHRDIKPSNLMLASERQQPPVVKILDMGLALLDDLDFNSSGELTTTGQVMGTLDYMSPEQASNSHVVDARSDIYSLGATLYKLLCGAAPFSGQQHNTPSRMLVALATQAAPSLGQRLPDMQPELLNVVDRMLAKDPADRYPTSREVAAALATFAEGANLASLLERAEAANADATIEQTLEVTHQGLKSRSVETEPTIDQQHGPATDQVCRRGRRWLIATSAALSGALLLGVVVLIINNKDGSTVVTIDHDKQRVQVIVEGDGAIAEVFQDGKEIAAKPPAAVAASER